MATISTEALQPTTTLPVTTVPDLSSQYANNINSVANLTQAANDAAAAEKTAQDQYLAKANEKANLESSYGMKANDTANLYQTTGVNDLYKQISGINTEAQGLARQAQAIPLQLQQEYTGRLSTQAGTSAIEAGRLRENALKSLELGQRAAIAQGNYDVAKNLADQQIASKYAGIDAEIKSKQTNLEALDKITLTAAQEKRKAAQTALLTKQANDIAEQKANDKGINDIAIEIAKNGGDVSVVKNAKTVSEAIQLAASSLKTPNTEVIKLGDKAAYLIDKTTGKIIKSFGGVVAGGGSSVISNPKLAGVVDTILASGKFTKDQAGVIRNAINNGENPTTVIKNNAKNIMGQTEATKLTNYESTKSAMTDLKNSINNYYAAGGETNLFKGNFEKVTNRLGEVKDPKLASLAVEIQANLQSYRNAISGTAYSDQEGQDIASVFPGINKSKQLNDAIFAGRDRALDSSINGLYKAALGESVYKQVKDIESGFATNISKGSLDDRSFVEKAVKSQTIPYDKLVNDTPTGSIPVVDNKTGEVGYLPINEYNASSYTKL